MVINHSQEIPENVFLVENNKTLNDNDRDKTKTPHNSKIQETICITSGTC